MTGMETAPSQVARDAESPSGIARSVTLSVNGYRFDALDMGPADGPLVLLLHGFPQFSDAWTEVMAPVAGAGFRAVAVSQRGYSPGARPQSLEGYHLEHLTADVLGFADALGARRFHLVGHDWGGIVSWQVAAAHADRLLSLSVLSTPHTDALLQAIEHDADQAERSRYITFFREPGGRAEAAMLADDAQRLRGAYRGKLSPAAVEANVRRLSEPGALTAALNWYRALDFGARIGRVAVPTLFIWGAEDHALGETAALATGAYVRAPYRFEPVEGLSHWLLDEAPERVASLVLEHLRAVH